MFDWLYDLATPVIALFVVSTSVTAALGGFEIARRTLLKRFKYHDGVNDAISGALGSLGVFYGITVGLIAIDVWQRHTEAQGLVAREAAAVQTLYLIVRPETSIGLSVVPDKIDNVIARNDTELADLHKSVDRLLGEYVMEVICIAWESQRKGADASSDWRKLRIVRAKLQSFQPQDEGQKVRYASAMQVMNDLSEVRRLRKDAVNDQLTWVMWIIILCGAIMSMCVVYMFQLEDVVLHRWIVGLLSVFLSFILLMIILNNRPFFGSGSLDPDSFVDIHWIFSQPTSPVGNQKRFYHDSETCQGWRAR
ncbi:DUF4239 domain-containing protein [Variovorax sp. J22P240]|uniref:bestrophin-like domain n=1 Tax=Variovorax sp. J22P240 TaxID=3053514 RepID=UPI00257923F0|nr:DUF4239 domain-containing protein [Variovorax sp. J22P240]MDL9998321.1 DUF4239 domain-containing protein [Variovorax sp. J22P240]